MRRVLLALFGLGALALPACGSGSEAAELERSTTTTSTTTTVPTTTTAPPTMPFTGQPVTDPALAARPALVVKIDNVEINRGPRPQAGLNQADVVFEELVEGGITRFLTVFHSNDADPVGPVRSARTSDIAIFTAFYHPLFAWSGAAGWVVPRVHASGAIDVGQDAVPGPYYRRGDRRGPHNLYSSTPALYGSAGPGAGTPPPQFTFRAPEDFLGSAARPVGGVDLVFDPAGAGSVPVQYRWDPAVGGWGRWQAGTPHVDEAGVQVAPQNVIVQFVPYGFDSPAVPLAEVIGTGPAWVFTNGHVVEGTWSKPSPEAVTQYLDAVGRPIGLTPGRTWVAVLPTGGAAVGSAVIV